MIERIIKRDGKKVKFSERRIRTAISNAMRSANESTYNARSALRKRRGV